MPAPLLPSGTLPGAANSPAVRADRAVGLPVTVATTGMTTVPGTGVDGVPDAMPGVVPGAAGGGGCTGDSAAGAGARVIDCNICSQGGRKRELNRGIMHRRTK